MNIFQPPNLAFFVGWVVYFSIRHHFIQRTKSAKKEVRQIDAVEKSLLAAMSVAVLLLPLLYLFTPLLSFADYGLLEFLRWTGLPVMLVSLWLFWRSHADLGENWSVSLELREGHQLISQGVYRRVRHPMYASIWLWGLAQAMMLANWLVGWSTLLAFAAMYFIRVPREEQLMCDRFGDDYRLYALRTGRLFPCFTAPPHQQDIGEANRPRD